MTKTIYGDLILKKDTVFDESIIVEGDIKGYWNLKVYGNIDCCNIDCRNIVCCNIDCCNIDCWDIGCRNIVCRNIIFCDKIKVAKKCKVICRFLIKDRFSVEKKEWQIKEKKK